MEYILQERYPLELDIPKGPKITLRPMESGDGDAMLEFFRSIPASERIYLRHDVTDPKVIDKWCKNLDYKRVLPLLALEGKKVVANASLTQNPRGWMSHIGDIRIVVGEKYRGRGLARMLTEDLIQVALNVGLVKLDALFMADQTDPIKTFERLGFIQAAVLPQHVWDQNGEAHDLVIMVNDLRDQEHYAAD